MGQHRDMHDTGRLGVTLAQHAFEKAKWLFRRDGGDTDYGLDAYVKVTDEGGPTGQLVALQIKSGASYFSEEKNGCYVYRGDNEHLRYWVNHSLPVIIVLVHEKTEKIVWQHVTPSGITKTPKGWKLHVPKHQHLDEHGIKALAQIAKKVVLDMSIAAHQRLQRLQADRNWMVWLAEERERILILDVRQYVSKLGGRADLTLIAIDEEGEEDVKDSWKLWLGSRLSFANGLRKLFCWADLQIEEDTYFMCEEEDMPRQLDTIYPYEDDGEFAKWRLEARLMRLERLF